MYKVISLSPGFDRRFAYLLLPLLLLTACVRQAPQPATPFFSGPTETPFQPVTWTPVPSVEPSPLPPTETPTPTLAPHNLRIAPSLPPALADQISLPPDWGITDRDEIADLRLIPGEEAPVSEWIFALAAPFPTIVDDVTGEELFRAWQGESDSLAGGRPLLISESSLELVSVLWGQPALSAVRVLPAAELESAAWEEPYSWAILPFENLNPRWKVIAIDGISPLHKDFDRGDYELVVPISLAGGERPEGLSIPASNRDADKLTTLAMTGVTALVRATAFTMEREGVTYPGQDVGPWLRAADLTHISNEVPFVEDCPYPNPVQQEMRFCSRDRYLDLLVDVGADIIELTGDHFSDWGHAAMLHTLDLYAQEGWLVYGGGADLETARQSVTVEHNGNRLAFLGCNAKPLNYAHATEGTPGAAPCDFEWMETEIERLRENDYLPIVTFQHIEYYTYAPQPDQRRDAQRMTEAGAIIVSGSQAHQPQAFEFSGGGFVHHGLGNLFFDQYGVSESTRLGFIDRHVFYDGRHISTELLTMMFVDYARPRPMTAEERGALLEAVFQASEW